MAKYMIHAYPGRMWYVEDFLIPSMLEQGIKQSDIILWNDKDRVGTLESCLRSFGSLEGIPDGTWHIPDDVIISPDFAYQTERWKTEGVVAAFGAKQWDNIKATGYVHPHELWFSFQCLHIPNIYASEFVHWFRQVAAIEPRYEEFRKDNKNDDYFFKEWFKIFHPDVWCVNLAPNLVDHIDYLLGGSVINKQRGPDAVHSYFWDHWELNDELEQAIEKRKEKTRHGNNNADYKSKSHADISEHSGSDNSDLHVGKRERGGK